MWALRQDRWMLQPCLNMVVMLNLHRMRECRLVLRCACGTLIVGNALMEVCGDFATSLVAWLGHQGLVSSTHYDKS